VPHGKDRAVLIGLRGIRFMGMHLMGMHLTGETMQKVGTNEAVSRPGSDPFGGRKAGVHSTASAAVE
jgi:hypothetical protein